VTSEIERLCALYGYRPITTPVFEDTALFERTSGVGSDVVQKEMYTFTDRGDRSLTLRPEGTASVARAYVEHGLFREAQPVKTYLIGPMYRYCGAAARKVSGVLAAQRRGDGLRRPCARRGGDPALRGAPATARDRGWWLELNSIGDRNCRPAYLDS
jgi:Histidyl-tRNA synthetase